jgi:hypothetical protein
VGGRSIVTSRQQGEGDQWIALSLRPENSSGKE